LDIVSLHPPNFAAEFVNAWIAWRHADDPISGYVLWGHPVFVWARWGKGLELLAAFMALCEIEALRSNASDFARDVAPKEVARSYQKAYKEIEEKVRSDRWAYAKHAGLVVCMVVPIFLVAWAFTGASSWLAVGVVFIESLAGFYFALAAILLLAMVFGPFARAAAWAGARKNRLLVLSFAIFFVGMTFDILAT
jgi:hypothetical protein